ncbi:MAG: response regulator [Calditrichaeota bacterium]|nr:MAG: response regulator [Calditrichota bacterium]
MNLIYVFLFGLAFTSVIKAQGLQFVNYTVADGLPQSQIHAVLQDRNGFLWFGTAGGISRYDGVQFKSWDKSNGMPQVDYVYSLLEDSKGNIWLGTLGGGLVRISDSPAGKDITVFNQENGFYHNQIYAMCEDKQGTLWFGSDSATVISYDGQAFSSFEIVKSEDNAYVRALAVDSAGVLWIGVYDKGLYSNKNGELTSYDLDDGLSDNRINAFAFDSKNNMWLASKGGLTKCITDSSGQLRFQNYSIEDGLPTNTVFSLAIDNKDVLWLGTRRGLSQFSEGKFRTYDVSNGLVNDRILSVLHDREGILWLGTVSGVSKLAQYDFENYTTEHGLPGNYISALYEDSKHRLWVGTIGRGIAIIQDGAFKTESIVDSLKNSVVRAFFEDKNGCMWIGTRHGLVKYSADNVTTYRGEDGLSGEYIRDIAQQEDGLIWLATNQGVYTFSSNTDKPDFKIFSPLKELENGSFWDILIDRNKNIWIQSNAGIFKFDGIHCIKIHGFKSDRATTAIEVTNGDIWFGTREGAARFDGEKIRNFTTDDGLSHNSVWAMVEGPLQNIWFGTNHGIDRFDGTRWANYRSRDGLVSEEVSIDCMLLDHRDNLWIGTNQGLSKYDYRKDYRSTIPPLVHFLGVESPERSHLTGNALQLDYSQNNISFEFIGLWYKNEKDVRYQYFLEGYERDWNKTTDRRYANYTNLDHGRYKFKVRARSGDGVWSANEAEITLDVLRPFWKTWWFYLLEILILVTLIFGTIKWRLARMNSQNEILESRIKVRTRELEEARQMAEQALLIKSEFLATMSHEIRTPMNGVIGMTDILLDTKLNDEQKEYAENVQSSAKSLLTIINDILDFSKIEAGKVELEEVDFNLEKLLSDVSKLFRFKAQAKGLVFESILDSAIHPFVIGDPGRIRQVLINLANNAVKFTSTGHVLISGEIEHERPSDITIKFSVKDTGIGIPKDRLHRLFQSFSQVDASTTRKYGGTGLGLAISQKLVELMGGQIGVTSKINEGSIFWFKIDLQKQLLKHLPINEKVSITVIDEKQVLEVINGELKILLAEDNIINQKVAIKILQKLGHQVHCVADGKKAVEAVALHHFDLVLMDCQMPEMDGYEATRSIRKNENSTQLPIVALTANAMKGDREKCLEAGMDDYLSKPIDPKKLETVLQRWVKSKVEEG